jgi:hypothetical protein
MNRQGHENTRFFVGTEVERTPVYGHRTLFVVGVQPVEDILHWAKNQECTHIYFGANHSFPNPAENVVAVWKPWEQMIEQCLTHDYWCTLDIDIGSAKDLLECGLVEHRCFIPMISVKLPYAQLFNYNTTIKIDDTDFAATNPGVWCHSLHTLQSRETFTSWSDYSKDATIQ